MPDTVLPASSDNSTSQTSDHPPPHRQTVPFPTLPLEVREQIYRFVLFPAPYHPSAHHIYFSAIDSIRSHDPRYAHWMSQLCLVNEATRIEVSLFLLRATMFGILYVAHIPYFQRFLKTLPKNAGFTALRRLDFPLFSRHQPNGGETNPYFELAKRCTQMTELRIKFDVGDLLKMGVYPFRRVTIQPIDLYVWDGVQVLELSRIIDTYRLQELLELRGLVKLTVEVWPVVKINARNGVSSLLVDCMPTMGKLAEWLRVSFAERGGEVEIGVVRASTMGLRWGSGV